MKAVFVLSLFVGQAIAYEGTLDVLKYASTIIDDARNHSSVPDYPGEYIMFVGSSLPNSVNVSVGILEDDDGLVHLIDATYVLDSHGKALAVIFNYKLGAHNVKYSYEVSYSESGRRESGTAVVSVGEYIVSTIINFIGGSYPVSYYPFRDSVGNVNVTSDSKLGLISTLVKSHWDSTGKNRLQDAFDANIGGAMYKHDINQYFNKH